MSLDEEAADLCFVCVSFFKFEKKIGFIVGICIFAGQLKPASMETVFDACGKILAIRR